MLNFSLRMSHLLLFTFHLSRPSLVGFSGGSHGKESACNAGDLDSIPGLGRSPGEGSGNPLQYSCLENPKDGGVWQATVHGVAKSDTTERLHFSMPSQPTLSLLTLPWFSKYSAHQNYFIPFPSM